MTMVVAIYTGQGLAEPLKAIFTELLPNCRLINIIDDSLIADVVKSQRVTPAVTRRLLRYYEIAAEMGANVILNTCSSVGEVVELGRQVVEIPIVRIDEPMALAAVKQYDRIGVIATLPSTLQPTMRLLQDQARRLYRPVTIVEGLAAGAYEALVSGVPAQHDQCILETALRLKPQVDAFVLAQGSMARMERVLAEATGKPVFSSLRLGIEAVKQTLAEG
ncbi:MAG TPA: aspartate/glutamate racemase family protein [Phototrophicaceae bacterium]|nr:aspartate/glutamate racemase family protein [Phototrophicaceae bacterium]